VLSQNRAMPLVDNNAYAR